MSGCIAMKTEVG